MKVVDDVVYIVSEASNHGLQYFDLHRLRVLDFFKLLPPDGVMKHHGSAHNIVANEEKKLLYVVGARFQGETCEGRSQQIITKCYVTPETDYFRHT